MTRSPLNAPTSPPGRLTPRSKRSSAKAGATSTPTCPPSSSPYTAPPRRALQRHQPSPPRPSERCDKRVRQPAPTAGGDRPLDARLAEHVVGSQLVSGCIRRGDRTTALSELAELPRPLDSAEP